MENILVFDNRDVNITPLRWLDFQAILERDYGTGEYPIAQGQGRTASEARADLITQLDEIGYEDLSR